MLDIDHFKNINDTYGHEFGDEVLKSISKVCLSEKPANSKVFRMGGEEFCTICKCNNLEQVVEAAENFRRKIEALEWKFGNKVTISGGVVISDSSKDLYNLADQQLYISKNSGRNRISYSIES